MSRKREKSWSIQVIGATDYNLKTEIVAKGRNARGIIHKLAVALSKVTDDHVQIYHGTVYKGGLTAGEWFDETGYQML